MFLLSYKLRKRDVELTYINPLVRDMMNYLNSTDYGIYTDDIKTSIIDYMENICSSATENDLEYFRNKYILNICVFN